MKKLFVFTAFALSVATLNSCTQEDTTEVPVESRMKPASNMRELTEQLKAYDARFVRHEEMPVRLPGGVKFNKLDYAKIAISDVCGVSVSAMLVYTVKKISPKFLFLSDIFLFPFVRQQVPVLAWRCSRRQRRCLVDDVRYIFKEVDALQPA